MARTAADLRGAAARAGLDVVSLERVPAPGGGSEVSSRMQFDDPWAAARLLCELADQDAGDPIVRAWAFRMLMAACALTGERAGPVLSPTCARAFLATVHASVQHAIKFVREPKETFQSARVTMRARAGDCDDHARLVHALALAGGQRSRLVFFEKEGQPVHVVAQLDMPSNTDGRPHWTWAETTIPARLGELPKAAAKRLRAAGQLPPRRRDDLGA